MQKHVNKGNIGITRNVLTGHTRMSQVQHFIRQKVRYNIVM